MMFGSSRHFSYDSPDYGGSLQSNGLSRELPSSQRSSLSRPSGKSIYMQRKEYSESMNREPDNFQYRVEHLFTCELDGREVRTLDDCLARLKMLETKGRVWGQEMILEVRGSSLQLTDIETKGELESLPLGSITQTSAILDSCAYNSLLTVTVKEWRGPESKVYMFQCEEVGAENIKNDLEKAVLSGKEDRGDPYVKEQNIRDSLETIIGQQVPGGFRKPRPPPDMQPDQFGPPPIYPPPQWNTPEYDQRGSPPPLYLPREEPQYPAVMPPPWSEDPPRQEAPPKPTYTNTERNVEILNHVLGDTEKFVERVAVALPKENSKKKKKKKDKNKANDSMPPPEEFVVCLQKIKYGFNLLAKLNGILQNPSAPDFVHILFRILEFLVLHCPRELPPSVVVPLLVEQTLEFLSKEVNPEEDKLWISLGDSWNIPRSKWPNGDQLPPYIPVFSEGWQPPPPIVAPPEDRQAPLRSPRPSLQRRAQNMPEQNSSPWRSSVERSNNMPQMRVMYDFTARNRQELSVMKGDVVQVLDQSRQWWKVRNHVGEEGHVPNNVLEPLDGGRAPGRPQDLQSPPLLNRTSRPEEVKAWLEYKGFSKLTVRTIGALTGALLLGMSRDELRAVCPEEGGRVFFQLQAVKSAMALASESGYSQYDGR